MMIITHKKHNAYTSESTNEKVQNVTYTIYNNHTIAAIL